MFEGLYLEKNWNWNQKYPVIRIDFAQGILTSQQQLDAGIMDMLHINAELNGVSLNNTETHLAFSELIRKLHQQTGHRVVVLVDEYDKPILDNITDPKTGLVLRDGLRNFYSVLKAQGAHLKFAMLTGVSKFSKVLLSSGLNNLKDISLDMRYGAVCGYTQQELESTFHEYLKELNLEKIKKWYNGYSFLAEPVYNPFDILLYLDRKQFKPYWFESGTPTFLIHLIREKAVPAAFLEKIKITETFMGSFDVDCIEPSPLLFQTGYLTIKKNIPYPGGIYYKLGFPNHEVKYAFNDALLADLTRAGQEKDQTKLNLLDLLALNDLDGLKQIFHAFFASIPYDWYRKNDMAGYEGYYCSIVYCYFTALGLDVRAEESTNHGQLDMAVLFNENAYIIEFKVNELTKPSRALDQVKQKRYFEKYTEKQTYLIGIEFSKQDRNITRFEWEKV